MIALGLSLSGALLVLLGALFTTSDASALRRGAVPLLALAVALGAFIQAEPAGLSKSSIVAVAHGADGLPASSTVTFQQPEGGRSVRSVVLERPLPAALPVLLGTLLLAFGFAVAGGLKSRLLDRAAPAAIAAFLGLSGAILAGAMGPSAGTGEGEVRAVLGLLPLGALGVPSTFTVPDGSWPYVAGSGVALFGAAALSLLLSFLPVKRNDRLNLVVGIGAALAAAGPLADLIVTGGFAWRGTTGILWSVGLLAAGALFDRESPRRVGAMAGAAAGLALLLLG